MNHDGPIGRHGPNVRCHAAELRAFERESAALERMAKTAQAVE